MAKKFQLQIPVDASAIDNRGEVKELQAVAQDAVGNLVTAKVKLDGKGNGNATFEFDQAPGRLKVALGPADLSAEEVLQLQTFETTVAPREVAAGKLAAAALRVPPVFWERWLRRCRTFRVTGRVLCRDGVTPVPGATICAYDVDYWWWWSGRQRVGCATTDAQGNFVIEFKWCCGWRPEWWWKSRGWAVEQELADRILPVLQAGARKLRLVPDPTPTLDVFTQVIGKSATVLGQPLEKSIGPQQLEELRERLAASGQLPFVRGLEPLKLWPWFPWQPWNDCTPDLVFRVTQDTPAGVKVLLHESFSDTRWNVPTHLDVNLVVREDGVCAAPDDPEITGACALLSDVCGVTVNHIGGNPGAAAAPEGFADPGAMDRPFAELISLEGQLGIAVDYYAFEVLKPGAAAWMPIPPEHLAGFSRLFWIPATDTFVPAPFPLTEIDGRWVYESRKHYETTHDPAAWDVTRFWTGSSFRTLALWLTSAATYNDGLHRLRILGYQRVGDTLTPLGAAGVLPKCSTNVDAGLVLWLDNRHVGPGAGHPTAADHPCGEGTVHACTREPDTDFLRVEIAGVEVGACGVVDARTLSGPLVIDFLAHDPDGHLGEYTLQVTWGENQTNNLLDEPGHSLGASPVPAPVPAASQVGPTYSAAVPPVWPGGAVRLTIPDFRQVFSVSCAYQLELVAHKRTIVNCSTSPGHQNRSHLSFTVLVD